MRSCVETELSLFVGHAGLRSCRRRVRKKVAGRRTGFIGARHKKHLSMYGTIPKDNL